MTTVHFVYPRDPARISSPWCIGNEVGQRLQRRYDVKFYDWRHRGAVDAAPGDVLLGHPHWSSSSVFKRSLSHPNLARRIAMSPYVGDPRQVAFMDQMIDRCDLYLAITGGYWFRRIAQTPMRRWEPKMVHLDLAVNRQHFPLLKQHYNPAGQRRFVYIGHTAKNKNVGFLSQLQQASTDADIHWIGRGRKPIAGLKALGPQDFATPQGREVVSSFDFMVTVGAWDANPTTVLEALSWGLIPVVSKQSGYEDCPGIVNVPIDDAHAAAAVLKRLQWCPDEELQHLRAQGEALLQRHFHWDRFHAQVEQAIESGKSPVLRRPRLGESLALFRHRLFH